MGNVEGVDAIRSAYFLRPIRVDTRAILSQAVINVAMPEPRMEAHQ
jgi:hypothetical protein